MHEGQKHIVNTLSRAVKNYEGSINAMKELAHWQTIIRKIEDISNLNGENDWDNESRLDTINALAREALFGKE